MCPTLLTLVLLLCTSSTFSLGIDGVRNTDIQNFLVKSICDDTDGICSDLVCASNEIRVTLSVDTLKAKGIDVSNIHLRDRRCTGFHYDDKNVYITWPLGEFICGTSLTGSNTYGTYENQIFLQPTGIIYREIYVINVSCSYNLNYNVSLPETLLPDVSITYIKIENVGEFKVKMAAYKDISYTTPYTDPVISLSTKSNLYVGVHIEDVISGYSLLMVNCFSTPTNNYNNPLQYPIIINSCPNPQDNTIRILENGVSTKGKFYIQMFKFVGDYTYVYVHCQVHLCPKTCAPTCSSRSSRRATDGVPEVQGTLTIGPIRAADFETDSVGKASGFSVITVIGFVLINRMLL